MLPLLAIGGVIGALMSTAKGASWLSGQLDPTKGAASASGKAAATPATAARMSQFAATLAAQAAGQNVPASAQAAASVPVQQHISAYDTTARIKAGLVAYGQIGEHRTHHSRPLDGTASDGAAAAGA
ncbi:MAG: hypothetical protein WA864_31755 [Acetobacteraceae bacterium]|jgi:hypothetical protein